MVWVKRGKSRYGNLVPRVFTAFKMALRRRPWQTADHVTIKYPITKPAVILKQLKSSIFLETRDLLFARVFSEPPFGMPRRTWGRSCHYGSLGGNLGGNWDSRVQEMGSSDPLPNCHPPPPPPDTHAQQGNAIFLANLWRLRHQDTRMKPQTVEPAGWLHAHDLKDKNYLVASSSSRMEGFWWEKRKKKGLKTNSMKLSI